MTPSQALQAGVQLAYGVLRTASTKNGAGTDGIGNTGRYPEWQHALRYERIASNIPACASGDKFSKAWGLCQPDGLRDRTLAIIAKDRSPEETRHDQVVTDPDGQYSQHPAAVGSVRGAGMSRSGLINKTTSNPQMGLMRRPNVLPLVLQRRLLNSKRSFQDFEARNMEVHLLQDAAGTYRSLDHCAVGVSNMSKINGEQLTEAEPLPPISRIKRGRRAKA
ncbi:MAG: hypothetical protein LQ338_003991 [Usnochroma carphineum]|nr:MAG: hypothetical protein LQ338_003991 [Usnochroma carphineum]